MKIHVLSAGKSITSGRDYHWNDDIIPDGIQPMQAMLNEQSGKYYSLVIAKGPGSGYSVFLARLPLVSGARDDLGRPICAGFLIQELSNEEARKLAIEYVKDKEHLARVLCTTSVIKTAADFEVDLEAAEKAVRELLSGELPDGSTPVTVGELWGESSAWERREELLGWLKNNRLSDRPGNRVILCYFTDPERLSLEEDLVLHYSDPTYTKELRKPQSPLKCFLPKPWMQATLGTIVAALLIWSIAKSCSTPPPTVVPAESTPKATDVPTPGPTDVSTPEPSDVPAPEPSDKPATTPTDKPAPVPTDKPIPEPSDKPATVPTDKPATVPTDTPTTTPTDKPIPEPSDKPATVPTDKPATVPTDKPATVPTDKPTPEPSDEPTTAPSDKPTTAPSDKPTTAPSDKPTTAPSDEPTTAPSDEPTTAPSDEPTSKTTPDPAPEPTDAPHTADEQEETHLPTTEENAPTE